MMWRRMAPRGGTAVQWGEREAVETKPKYCWNRLFTICSGTAPISTGASPEVVESRTVLIALGAGTWSIHTYNRPIHSTFFANLGRGHRGTSSVGRGGSGRESITK